VGVVHVYSVKKNNRSSEHCSHINSIRDDGSYIYEEYIKTDGLSDIKVYMVGPSFVYAERRKAPVVDGLVDRAPNGNEIRHNIELNRLEMELVMKVYSAFHQTVCGFDILRDEKGTSFVCDINGWSFVKDSDQYYDICSNLLLDLLYQNSNKNNKGSNNVNGVDTACFGSTSSHGVINSCCT